jgi:hypothetical protein
LAENRPAPVAFAPGLWLVDGPVVDGMAGFRFPTRMAVIRLADGGLFVWSPVALNGALSAGVDALGPVAEIVAPNALHHLALAEWRQAYPSARMHAAPGLAGKRTEIAFATRLGDVPDPAWSDQIDQVLVPNTIAPEVVFFHRASGTAIFTDLLQQFPPGWFRGWRGLVARLDGMVAAEPQVPRKFRMATRNKAAARTALDTIRSWPAENVVLAHGTPFRGGGDALIQRAFRWL